MPAAWPTSARSWLARASKRQTAPLFPRLLLPAALAAAFLAACSGGAGSSGSTSGATCGQSDNAKSQVITPSNGDYTPITISSDIAAGRNRFVIGLVDKHQSPVSGAQLHFRFFCFADSAEKLYKAEADATPITIQKNYTHTHPDGTVETHPAGEIGVYVANVDLDSAGRWGVEVSGTVNGKALEPQSSVFDVRTKSLSPAIGDPAPPSVQPLLSDVGGDITKIDTSDPPGPQMHQMTVADAIKSGTPTVIVFATPAFCTSQICGPTKNIVDDLYQKYQGQANFIHIEPYFLDQARSGKGLCPLPIVNLDFASHPQGDCPQLPASQLPPADESWNLQSEPWVFVVDRQGKIAGKFEGVVSLDELEQALKATLAGP